MCWGNSLSVGSVAESSGIVVAPAPEHTFEVGGARMNTSAAYFVLYDRI